MTLGAESSNPFKPPGSDSPAAVAPTNNRQLLLRCFGWLFLLGSTLPICVILFFVRQDYWRSDRYPARFVSYDSELVGVGHFSNEQLLGIALVLTLATWGVGITFLLLSRKR